MNKFKIINNPLIDIFLRQNEICIKYHNNNKLFARKYIYSTFGKISFTERELPILFEIKK